MQAPGHKLDTDNRPEQVGYWIKCGRPEKSPPIKDVQRYGDEMRSWWTTLQPAWRRDHVRGKWPLSRVAPEDEDWDRLARGGANGLMMFVIALGWWVEKVNSYKSANELVSVVEDVKWVLAEMKLALEDGRIVKLLTARGGTPQSKRGLEDGEKESKARKR